uniref:S100/CaBP-9k-type calcium binding subdomain domain-containing protein n=1 Tax=Amphilophus citrinellus TaxID=61819 RepID=A0A3Q0TBI4_AMPCI
LDLESSMITIIQTFHKYSGQKYKLKKAELKQLINNEMNHFIMLLLVENLQSAK